MRVIGLAGWSGAGKTTLVTRVIPHFLQQGLRVSVMEVGDQVEITERVEQRIVFLIEKADSWSSATSASAMPDPDR